MKRRTRLNIILSLGFLTILGWGIYALTGVTENFIYWKLSNPDLRLASLRATQNLFVINHRPIRNWTVEDPIFQAKSVLAAEVNHNQWRILFAQNNHYPFAIASLTKLMTALVVVDHYPLNQMVDIDEAAVNQIGDVGLLKVGERWRVQDLLRMSLMESSNDAAYALAEVMGVDKFVEAMNEKAANLGLSQTRFVNPTGLEEGGGETNMASSQDLAQLVYYLLSHPSYRTLQTMISCPEFRLLTPTGQFHHTIINSNKLLGQFTYLIGGKTGYLANYGGSLVSIFQQPNSKTYLITVVLDSPKRFGETKQLLQWLSRSYLYLFHYGSLNSHYYQ